MISGAGVKYIKAMEFPGDWIQESFEEDGFCLFPSLIPADLVGRVTARMDAVISGEYAAGTRPHAVHFGAHDPPDKLRKIDQPHLVDPDIFELVSHPEIGRAVAELLKASFVQVWASQLLLKPPGGTDRGNIGWHQDMQHWKSWWRGEVGTIWVAVSDILQESGPMRFVRGSHKWGLNKNPSFFGDSDHVSQREAIPRPPGSSWQETPALLSAGGASFHHRFTYHGSGPNCSTEPRRSFAIHIRTERSEPIYGDAYYTAHLDEDAVCPVIYSE